MKQTTETMVIVIDGYNLLKQLFSGCKKQHEKHRNLFVHYLADYKAAKEGIQLDIVVVFDAGPTLHTSREVYRGIAVIFSGQRSSADEWIIEYSRKHKGEDLLIVTNDRGIIAACRRDREGGKDSRSFMDVQAFYAIVQEKMSKQSSAIEEKTKKSGRTQRKDMAKRNYSGERDLVPELEKYEPQEDVDDLMREMSVGIQDTTTISEVPDDKRTGAQKQGNSHKKSKNERLQERKISKLK